jgi:hypothetical protein
MKTISDLYQRIGRNGNDLAWQNYAACADYPHVADLWFAESLPDPQDRKHGVIYTKHAQQICSGCPVMNECGDYAITNHEQFGIWGGLTAEQRRNIWKGLKT